MDPLKRRTLTHRAVLAGVLWLGFWVLGLLLTAALLWVPLAQSLYEGGVRFSGWLSGAGGAAVLWALRPRRWWMKPEARPAGLDSASYPALHALIGEAGLRLGEKLPDEVQLVSKATAFISVERQQVLTKRQVIGLGLPLFAFLSREELGSVLVHEFGHRRGGDLLLGPWVHRTGSSLASVIDSLEGSPFFLDAPFRAYGKLFLRVSGDVSREQEFSADARAAEVYGAKPTCDALDKVHRLGHFWDVYFALEAAPVIQLGCRPPLVDGFRRFLAQTAFRPEVVEALQTRARAKATVGDSHPPLEERINALSPGVRPTGEPSVKDLERNSLELLGGERAAEAAWYERATRGEFVTLAWDEVGPKLLLPKFLEQFSKGSIDPHTTAPTTLPEKVRDAQGFWNRWRTPGPSLLSPAAQRRRGEVLLGQWLAAALFVRGFTPEVRPGAHLRLSRGANAVVPAEVVEQLAQGSLSAAAFRTLSADWEKAA